MTDKFDKNSKPLKLMEWAKLVEDKDYKRVAEITLPDGKWISTVWLGLNHNWGEGKPLIFETMVFPSKSDLSELDIDRYSTLEEAQKGHEEFVKKYS
jgi:hypothetical protein